MIKGLASKLKLVLQAIVKIAITCRYPIYLKLIVCFLSKKQTYNVVEKQIIWSQSSQNELQGNIIIRIIIIRRMIQNQIYKISILQRKCRRQIVFIFIIIGLASTEKSYPREDFEDNSASWRTKAIGKLMDELYSQKKERVNSKKISTKKSFERKIIEQVHE